MSHLTPKNSTEDSEESSRGFRFSPRKSSEGEIQPGSLFWECCVLAGMNMAFIRDGTISGAMVKKIFRIRLWSSWISTVFGVFLGMYAAHHYSKPVSSLLQSLYVNAITFPLCYFFCLNATNREIRKKALEQMARRA